MKAEWKPSFQQVAGWESSQCAEFGQDLAVAIPLAMSADIRCQILLGMGTLHRGSVGICVPEPVHIVSRVHRGAKLQSEEQLASSFWVHLPRFA